MPGPAQPATPLDEVRARSVSLDPESVRERTATFQRYGGSGDPLDTRTPLSDLRAAGELADEAGRRELRPIVEQRLDVEARGLAELPEWQRRQVQTELLQTADTYDLRTQLGRSLNRADEARRATPPSGARPDDATALPAGRAEEGTRYQAVEEDLRRARDRAGRTDYRAPVRPEDIQGARPWPPGSATPPGHAEPKHHMTPAHQAEILNDPERVWTGVNDRGRPVDIYYRDQNVVITEAGDRQRVITAYGTRGGAEHQRATRELEQELRRQGLEPREIQRRVAELERVPDPPVSPERWDRHPSYVEVENGGRGPLGGRGAVTAPTRAPDDVRLSTTGPGGATDDELGRVMREAERQAYQGRLPNELPIQHLRQRLSEMRVPNPTATVQTYADIPAVQRHLTRLEELARTGAIHPEWAGYDPRGISYWQRSTRRMAIFNSNNPLEMTAALAHEGTHVGQTGIVPYRPGMTREAWIGENMQRAVNGEVQTWRVTEQMWSEFERYGLPPGQVPREIRDIRGIMNAPGSERSRRRALQNYILDDLGYRQDYQRMYGHVWDNTAGVGRPQLIQNPPNNDPPAGSRRPEGENGGRSRAQPLPPDHPDVRRATATHGLTPAEASRYGQLRGDLDRVQEMIPRDPAAAMRELEEAARHRDWSGLRVQRQAGSNITDRTVNDLWGEVQELRRGGDARTPQQLAYLLGLDEGRYRLQGFNTGGAGEVRIPGPFTLQRPNGVPQDVFDAMRRGMSTAHAETVLRAHQQGAGALVRPGTSVPVELAPRGPDLPDDLAQPRPAPAPADPTRPAPAPAPQDQPVAQHRPRPGEPAPADPVAPRPAELELHPDVRRGLDPQLVGQLSADDVRRVGALGTDAASRESLSGLLRSARTPEETRRILGVLEGANPASRQALTQALGGMSPESLHRFLGQTIGDQPAGQVLGRVMHTLPEESRAALGRVMGALAPEAGTDFLRFAQHLDGRELAGSLGTIDTAIQNLRRVAPGLVNDVGRMFGAMNQVVSRLGLQMTGQVAGRVLRGLGAMLPAAGTAFAAYDMVRMGQVAADSTLPRELRFLGGAGVALNGVDAALGVAEMFGVGNIGLPANLALGAAALGLDLYTHHQIDQFRANPEGWRPSRGLNAFVAGTALSMGPTGAAMLVGTFGPSGAQEKMLDLGQVGGELAINAARLGGVAAADGAGGAMRFTARGIDALADAIRNPERLGEGLRALGVSAQQLGRNAIGALGDAASYAGDLGRRAIGALNDTGTWLMGQGQRGLETLQWMMNNPGETWRIAQDRIGQVIQRGGELGRQALDGLANLGQRGLETAQRAMTSLRNAGQEGLEMLRHAYTRFRDNPAQAFRELGNSAIDGIQHLAQQGGQLAQNAVRSLIDFVNDQPRLAQRAVTALRDLAQQGGTAIQEIANAWGRNLTEGGRAVLASLENLGGAGVDALGRLGRAGGELAMQAGQSLGRLFGSGVAGARDALQAVAGAMSPENLRRFLLDTPAQAARAVFDSLGGRRIGELLQGAQNLPGELARLYDQLDWRHVRQAFGNLTRDGATALLGALDPRRLSGFVQHFDGEFLRNVWDMTGNWGTARRMFESVGSTLQGKLAAAIGSERLAGLVNTAGTSIDWIRTHLSGVMAQTRALAGTLQHVTGEGLGRLRDALGVDRLTSTFNWMRGQGMQFTRGLLDGARALGDQTLQGALGMAQAVQQHARHVVRSYDNGVVSPFNENAVWWIGPNPFARGNILNGFAGR